MLKQELSLHQQAREQENTDPCIPEQVDAHSMRRDGS